MKALLTLLMLISPISQNSSNSLTLTNVIYKITRFQNTPVLEFNVNGVGTATSRIRVCDNSLGCREDTPSTIHQSQEVNFNEAGIHFVEILKFSKDNESKRINIMFTNNLGATTNLNFTISSAFPKSYSIVSTTLSKVIRESSYVSVLPNNSSTVIFNNFDFRSFYLKQNQNRIINFKDYLVSNGGVYKDLTGFVQLIHGLEGSTLTKVNSYYHFEFSSQAYQDKILIVLDNFYVDRLSYEMTKSANNNLLTNNIVVSKNYNKSLNNNLIFNFRNVGEHGSNIRVTAPFTINKDIFGSCLEAIVCVNKRVISPVIYNKVIHVK